MENKEKECKVIGMNPTITTESQENPVQPTQPTQTISRVLVEFLVLGLEENKDEIRKGLEALQKQMAKAKKSTRILWYLDKGEKTDEEKKEWLLANSKCKYYIFIESTDFSDDYVKQIMNAIRMFESGYEKMKELNIKYSKPKA